MIRHRLTTAALGAILFVVSIGNAKAQAAKQLVGTWMLVSNVNTAADGTTTFGYTKDPKGVMVFDPNGHFVLLNTRPDLPKFSSNNRTTGTAEENKAIVQGSLGFFGTYTVEDNVITLKVDGGTWPSWYGTVQKRPIISLTADELKYSVAASVGGSSENVYRRIK